jgi:hypothetical protein
MTQRERTLAFLLLPPLLLFGGGFLVYQLWIEPLRQRDNQIQALEGEIEEKWAALKKLREKKKELERIKPASLPHDADLARREYEEELSKLLRTSGFEAGTFSVTPKPIDSKTSPTLAKNKPPIFNRLIFTIQAKGDLLSLVQFMEKFYSNRLLHQIRNFTLQRPITADRNRPNELDINMTIEALVLDVAQQRKTLHPEKEPEIPMMLAGGERTYGMIAGKDMFFGPPPPVVAAPERPRSSIDFAQFVKFVSYSESEDTPPVITLMDAYNNNEIIIRPRADGDGYRVDVMYMLNNRKRTLRSGRSLDIMDERGELQHRWLILKISEREIFMQDEDDYYVLHIGQRLSDMAKLTTEEAAELGLIPPKAADKDEKDKPANGEERPKAETPEEKPK